jgi:hypothetical protein
MTIYIHIINKDLKLDVTEKEIEQKISRRLLEWLTLSMVDHAIVLIREWHLEDVNVIIWMYNFLKRIHRGTSQVVVLKQSNEFQEMDDFYKKMLKKQCPTIKLIPFDEKSSVFDYILNDTNTPRNFEDRIKESCYKLSTWLGIKLQFSQNMLSASGLHHSIDLDQLPPDNTQRVSHPTMDYKFKYTFFSIECTEEKIPWK